MCRTICASLLVSLLSAVLSAQSAKPEPLIINGQVLDDHGHPVAGASVTASPVGGLKGRLPMTTADGRGEFLVVVHQTGAFVVTASKTEEALLSTANPFYQASLDPTAQVTVVTSQLPPFATVHLGPKAGKLIMRVSDADANTPVNDVQISLCRGEAPRYCHRSSGKSSKGLYPELVPAAPFTIKVSAAGYEDSDSVGALQLVQLASETTKELTVLLHKIGTTDNASKLLPAPQNLSPADGAIFSHFPRTTTLEWSTVPGAVSYTVELDLCDWERPNGTECKVAHPLTTWRVPPTSGIEGTSYQFVFLGSQPGRWRVWGVDAQGRPGAKTPWLIFVYSDH